MNYVKTTTTKRCPPPLFIPSFPLTTSNICAKNTNHSLPSKKMRFANTPMRTSFPLTMPSIICHFVTIVASRLMTTLTAPAIVTVILVAKVIAKTITILVFAMVTVIQDVKFVLQS